MSLPIPSLAGGDGVYTLSAGGLSVALPNSISSGPEAISTTVYHEEIPGRDGLFTTRGAHFLGRALSLSGVMYDSATVLSLKRVLAYKRVTVRRGSREMVADVSSVSIFERVTDKIWQVAIDLASPNYYWSATTETTTGSSPTTVTNAGEYIVYPTFTFTVPASTDLGGGTYLRTVEFDIAGRTFSWENTGSAAGTLVVSCAELAVKLDGTSLLDEVNDSFFVNPPRLEPGDNTVTFTSSGTTSAVTYVVTHTERFM